MKQIQNNSNNDKTFRKYNQVPNVRKQEPFAKTFQKRYEGAGVTIDFPKKEPNILNKSKSKSQLKQKQNSHKIINNINENIKNDMKMRSQHKFQDLNSTSRQLRMYKQTKFDLILTKLDEVISIFYPIIGNEPSQIIKNLYNKNDQYVQLLYEWQKQQLYDEIDKRVYKLTQNYVRLIENLFKNMCTYFNNRLQKYESQIRQLQIKVIKVQQQNLKLKNIFQGKEDIPESKLSIIISKLRQQYEKNLYATFLLAQIQKNNFDLENFARIIPEIDQTQRKMRISNVLEQNEIFMNNQLNLLKTKSQITLKRCQINDQSYQKLNQNLSPVILKRSCN